MLDIDEIERGAQPLLLHLLRIPLTLTLEVRYHLIISQPRLMQYITPYI